MVKVLERLNDWRYPAAAIVILLVVDMFGSLAYAHSWYDYSCCALDDCGPVALGGVERTEEGWFIKETGETIHFEDERIKQSKDPNMHRCHYPNGTTRCLYVPEIQI